MIIMNTGSRLSNMISSDSTSSDRSTIMTQCTPSFTLFGSDNDSKHQPQQQHQTTSCPLRSRTSSEVSWFSASDDEDDDGDDADIDLIPAIHKTINACSLYYGHDDDQTSATSFSCSSSVSNSPTGSTLIRRQVSFDELALLQLKFADLSSSVCTNSVRSSTRTVQFSEDPPSIFSYERPEPQYHFLLYYDDDEMDIMMNDYASERR